LRQTPPTKQLASRPVLQMIICIFFLGIFIVLVKMFSPVHATQLTTYKCQTKMTNCQTKMLSTRTLKHFALQLWCKISV